MYVWWSALADQAISCSQLHENARFPSMLLSGFAFPITFCMQYVRQLRQSRLSTISLIYDTLVDDIDLLTSSIS